MAKFTLKEVMSKLGFIQTSIWNMEETSLKYAGSIAKQTRDIEDLKSHMDMLSEKLNNIADEVRALRIENADGNGGGE